MQMISSYGYSNNNMDPKSKKILRYVIIGIVAVLIISAVLIGAIYYLNSVQEKSLKLYVDGKKVSFNESMFIIRDNKVYVAIKDIAKSLGYDSHNGEYKISSEDQTKCYVENANETASFFIGSNKISKVVPNSSNEYSDFIIPEPVFSENNKLYVIDEGIERGLNCKLNYITNTNTIQIQTLPNLVSTLTPYIEKIGYKGLSEEFENQKGILDNMYVVINNNDKYGVIDNNGKEIIGCKYDKLLFNENAREFFVTNTYSKVGIVLANGTNKIDIKYDEITNIDKDLYLVKMDNKYGVIDKNGILKVNNSYENIKILDKELGLFIVKYNGKYGVVNDSDTRIIYWEYDEIGIDNTLFKSDNIENKYLLLDNLIPVRKDKRWGLFNVKGEEVIPCEYDGLGCIPTNIKDRVVNNSIIIKDIKGIIVSKDKKYGIIKENGEIILECVLNAVYSTTNAGNVTYHLNYDYNGRSYDYELLWYLEQTGKYTPATKNNENNSNITQNTNVVQNTQVNSITNTVNNSISIN